MSTDTHRLPFHRLAHDRPTTARWWRPLATFGVAAGLALAGSLALILVAAIATLVAQPAWRPSELLDDPRNPGDMLFMLGFLAIGVPAVVLGSRWGGGMRGAIHSVARRFRWALLLRAASVVVPLYAAVLVGSFVISPPADFSWPAADGRTLAVFAIVLLLAPLQCAAEEYAFRALPQQMLGTWLRSPLWGILLPVPLFMVGHGYDVVGQIDIAVFAVCMGFLVWKSGGVELAIVVHTANNLVLFLLAPFSPSSLVQGTVEPWTLLLSLPLTLGVTAGLALWVSRTHRLRFFEPVRSAARPPVTPGPGSAGPAESRA
jgi:membrane protease YdiL (CAAX protease family)